MITSTSRADGTSATAPVGAVAKAESEGGAAAGRTSDVPLRESGKITALQALENTRALLNAKLDKTRRAPNYPVGAPVHPGAHGPHGVAAAQTEHAPADRLVEAIHGHAYATERGDESKRSQR